MSRAIITESKLTAIANAIRAKTGSSDTLTPDEMATAVENIGGLPSEYEAVECIRSDGNQYIDLGFYADEETEFEVDCKFNSYSNNPRIGLVAGYSGNSRCAIGAQNTGQAYFGICASNINPAGFTDVTSRHTYKVSIPEKKGYIDGVEYAQGSGTFSVGSRYNALLFAVRGSQGAENKTSADYYGATVKTRTITAVLTPCKRKSDDKLGVYDLNNRHFHTNQGTGDFVVPSA